MMVSAERDRIRTPCDVRWRSVRSRSTTFHVMEWYVNFGATGVFLGSLLFGIVLAVIDRIAVTHLEHGDWSKFCLWYLSALSLLQVGGSLVEAVAGAAGGLVIGLAILQLRPARLPPAQPRLVPDRVTVTMRSR